MESNKDPKDPLRITPVTFSSSADKLESSEAEPVHSSISDVVEEASAPPIFFNIPDTPPKVEEAPAVSVEETVPLVEGEPAPLGVSEVVQLPQGVDDLPDPPSLGSQLAFWSFLLSGVGLAISFFPILGILVAAPFFLVAFILAVVSFFKKPVVPKSVAATVVSLILPVVGVGATLLLPMLALKKELPKVQAQMEKEAQNQKLQLLEKAGATTAQGKALGKVPVPPGVKPVGSGTAGPGVVPPVLPEDEPPLVSEPELLVPPEERPLPPVLTEPVVVLPPEERKVSDSVEAKALYSLWVALEQGMDVNATPYQRNLAIRISNVVGYPLSTLATLDSDQRLYLVTSVVERSGIDMDTLLKPR